MRATLSIRGLYKWDDTILDLFRLPEEVSFDLLKDQILTDCAELEILFPDPVFMKARIGSWSQTMLPLWERYNNAIMEEYNPLENYDRQEDFTDTHSGQDRNVTQADNTETGEVSAFNSSTYQPASKNTLDADGSSTFTHGHKLTHSGRVHGNIGVTTSQQMLASELDLIPRLNIYDKIVNDFKAEFCLLVY